MAPSWVVQEWVAAHIGPDSNRTWRKIRGSRQPIRFGYHSRLAILEMDKAALIRRSQILLMICRRRKSLFHEVSDFLSR